MADNVSTIVAFLKANGFSKAGIAGALGNFQVESGDNPAAYNAGEGAIGIAQWELGRRTALDSYAQQTGGSETSLNTQLGYMMKELTESYPSVLSGMRTATDPSAAAALWDQVFEGSAGTSRGAREDDAVTYFNNGLIGKVAAGPTGPGTVPGAGGAIQDVSNPVVGALKDLNPLKYLGDAASSIPNGLAAMAAPFTIISGFFQKLLWIFTPSHFMKFMLYANGALLVIVGLAMAIFGAGKDRPA